MSQEAKQFFSLDRSGFEEAVEALHALSGMLLFEFARQEELSLSPTLGSPETLRKVKNINWLTGSFRRSENRIIGNSGSAVGNIWESVDALAGVYCRHGKAVGKSDGGSVATP